jgi:hypothetical protein
MSDLDIYEHHQLIRDTVGYDVISEIDVFDLPEIMKFLNIVHKYSNMVDLLNE